MKTEQILAITITYILVTGLMNGIKVHDEHNTWQYSFNEQLAYFIIGFITGFIMIPYYLFCGFYEILRDKLR